MLYEGVLDSMSKPEWHERWAEDLEGLHDRCWDLMQKLGEQRDLEDAAGDA